MVSKRQPQYSDKIFYSSPEGNIKVEVLYRDESFWLTQKRMAELFVVESHTITHHLKEIHKTGELDEVANTRKIRVVQKKGLRRTWNELQDNLCQEKLQAVKEFNKETQQEIKKESFNIKHF